MNHRNTNPRRNMLALTALLGLFCAAASLRSAPPAEGPSIHVLNDKSDRPFAFEAIGLAAEQIAALARPDDSHERFSQILAVYVVDTANDADLPAVAGTDRKSVV